MIRFHLCHIAQEPYWPHWFVLTDPSPSPGSLGYCCYACQPFPPVMSNTEFSTASVSSTSKKNSTKFLEKTLWKKKGRRENYIHIVICRWRIVNEETIMVECMQASREEHSGATVLLYKRLSQCIIIILFLATFELFYVRQYSGRLCFSNVISERTQLLFAAGCN